MRLLKCKWSVSVGHLIILRQLELKAVKKILNIPSSFKDSLHSKKKEGEVFNQQNCNKKKKSPEFNIHFFKFCF